MSRQVDYALQLIVVLAERTDDTALSLKTFAKESTISFLFLQKIARQLRDAQLITATKGAHGGYRLARDPSTIFIGDIIGALEGIQGLAACTRNEYCEKEGNCPIQGGIAHVQHQITQYLAKTSVADIASYARSQ